MTKTEQEKIEIGNAMEEIAEIVEKCVECGLCKALCPVFKTILNETVSPRGKAIALKHKAYHELLYKCTLCMACKQKCPLGLDLPHALRKAREVLALSGKELKANKDMLKNVEKYGNAIGKPGEKPEKLFCC